VRIASGTAELIEATADLRASGREVSFVPTMGSLHEGHLSLVRAARASGNATVASVFVNPRQFAVGEDFDSYPRDGGRDADLLRDEHCDLLFLPSEADVYPEGFASSVSSDSSLVGCLCASSRGSSHFDGVVTVLARLFGLVDPDVAWFGEKDWQQLLVVRRLAADLFPRLSIEAGATVRDSDGLALSSRNARLSADARLSAGAIPEAISGLREWARGAEPGADLEGPLAAAAGKLVSAGLEPEYVEVRDGSSLAVVDEYRPGSGARIFVAVQIEGTRLIDNASLTAPDGSDRLPAVGAIPNGAAAVAAAGD